MEIGVGVEMQLPVGVAAIGQRHCGLTLEILDPEVIDMADDMAIDTAENVLRYPVIDGDILGAHPSDPERVVVLQSFVNEGDMQETRLMSLPRRFHAASSVVVHFYENHDNLVKGVVGLTVAGIVGRNLFLHHRRKQ